MRFHIKRCTNGGHTPQCILLQSRCLVGQSMNVHGILASALAKPTLDRHRLILGERLFPLVAKLENELVAKITGMLLEMDRDEIPHLLKSPYELKSKVEEAVAVLHSVHSHSPSDQFNSFSLHDNSDCLASLFVCEGVG